MPVSVDDELDTDPELRVELPCVATPKATLPQVGKQGDTVCHVTLHIERQRTAVDEGVPVVQRGAVMQHLLPPIYRLISGESRSPGIDENNLSGVRQYLEVIAALRRELRHGYLGVLVGIVLQQVFATEHPLVPLLRVGGESRPEAVPPSLPPRLKPSAMSALTSMPCIFGRHRWACACPVKRASDAMIIAMYFLMVSVLEVR